MFLAELKRSKLKFPPESSAHYTHQLLFKLMRSIYSSSAYPSLFLEGFVRIKRFIETCILVDPSCPQLINFNGEHKLVIDYICIGVLTNTLKIFREQSYTNYEFLRLLYGKFFFGKIKTKILLILLIHFINSKFYLNYLRFIQTCC